MSVSGTGSDDPWFDDAVGRPQPGRCRFEGRPETSAGQPPRFIVGAFDVGGQPVINRRLLSTTCAVVAPLKDSLMESSELFSHTERQDPVPVTPNLTEPAAELIFSDRATAEPTRRSGPQSS